MLFFKPEKLKVYLTLFVDRDKHNVFTMDPHAIQDYVFCIACVDVEASLNFVLKKYCVLSRALTWVFGLALAKSLV